MPARTRPTACFPPTTEIDADLALLQGKVKAVRTYSVEATLAHIPDLAEKHDLNVTLGAWIDDHRDKNEQQLTTAIELAGTHINVGASSSATRWCCAATCRSRSSRPTSTARAMRSSSR